MTLFQHKSAAVQDVHAPSGRLVEDKMTGAFERRDFNLPKPANLVRLTNRARQSVRPKEPESLDFEVSLCSNYLNLVCIHVNFIICIP